MEPIRKTSFLPFPLPSSLLPPFAAIMLTLQKTLDKGLVRAQDSPVSQSSLPAARQAWGREQSWHQPCSVGWNRSWESCPCCRDWRGSYCCGLGTGPTGINMFPSRFRQTANWWVLNWSHPTGGQSIAQKFRLAGGLIIKRQDMEGVRTDSWCHLPPF